MYRKKGAQMVLRQNATNDYFLPQVSAFPLMIKKGNRNIITQKTRPFL